MNYTDPYEDDFVNPFSAGVAEVPEAGSYHVIALMDDGGSLCETCVRDVSNPVHDRRGDKVFHRRFADGWGVVAFYHSGECDSLTICDHCNRVLVEDWEDE
jgi:hypothetical protein